MKSTSYQKPAFNLPVVQKTWTLDDLEAVLTAAILTSTIQCIEHNRGVIFTALSGGLDSSFCLAVIRRYFGVNFPIYTFTVGMEEHPDVQCAKKVAEAFKTNHKSILVDDVAVSVVAYMKDSHPDLFWGEIGKIAGGGPILLLQAVKKCADTFQRPIGNEPRLIVHDGIDELLGGYWEHRKHKTLQQQEDAFKAVWSKLHDDHLFPLGKKAEFYKVVPLFPYLQPAVVDYISRIPVNERTSHAESKIPLRRIAEKYLPREIIERKKIGFCDALKEF